MVNLPMPFTSSEIPLDLVLRPPPTLRDLPVQCPAFQSLRPYPYHPPTFLTLILILSSFQSSSEILFTSFPTMFLSTVFPARFLARPPVWTPGKSTSKLLPAPS